MPSTDDRSRSETELQSHRPSRREFTAIVGSAVALAIAPAAVVARAEAITAKPLKGRKVMVIDLDRCMGCKACAVACKAEHGVRLGGFRSWVSEEEVGRQPEVAREFLPRLCNHCRNAPCEKVCPTGATKRRADGIVTIDSSLCIGCRHCMAACPYNSRYFNSQNDPEELQERFPARTHGTVDKCNFCKDRVDAGGQPACVATCNGGARLFGDAEDPDSDVFEILKSGRAVPLLGELGTEPSVFYTGGRPELFRRG